MQGFPILCAFFYGDPVLTGFFPTVLGSPTYLHGFDGEATILGGPPTHLYGPKVQSPQAEKLESCPDLKTHPSPILSPRLGRELQAA